MLMITMAMMMALTVTMMITMTIHLDAAIHQTNTDVSAIFRVPGCDALTLLVVGQFGT